MIAKFMKSKWPTAFAVGLGLVAASCDTQNDQVLPKTDEIVQLPALSNATGPVIEYTKPVVQENGRTTAETLMYRAAGSVISAGAWQNVFNTGGGWDLSATYKGQIYNYGGGNVDLYVFNYVNGWVFLSGTSGNANPKSFSFSMKANQNHYFWAYCSAGSNVRFDVALYKVTPDANFPVTEIQNKDSQSAYATSLNVFKSPLQGQCTWYTYGRIQELAAKGYLSQASADRLKNVFSGKTNRHAKNWPGFIGGTWYKTAPKKGSIVVWQFGSYGHVGFVESVSADKKSYVISEFNYYNDLKYRTKVYTFGVNDKISGVAPMFYDL